MSFSIYKLLTVILVAAVVGVVLMFLFKVDITKYFEFLPDFDANKEDKVIEDNLFQGGESGGGGAERDFEKEPVSFLQEGETCCCLYENNINIGECKGARLVLNQYCSDKLGDNWVNVDDEYCKK